MGLLSNMFGSRNSNDQVQIYVDNGAKVIDVRTKDEFNGGHPQGAINIPMDILKDNLDRIKTYKQVVVCCASGMRSANAASYLKKEGVDVVDAGPWQHVPLPKDN